MNPQVMVHVGREEREDGAKDRAQNGIGGQHRTAISKQRLATVDAAVDVSLRTIQMDLIKRIAGGGILLVRHDIGGRDVTWVNRRTRPALGKFR